LLNFFFHNKSLAHLFRIMSHADDAPNPSQQLLNNAIDTSTIARLRIVLRDMCSESPEAFKLACDKLLVQGKDPKQVPGRTAQRPIHLEDDDDDDDEDEDEDENETDSDEEDYEDYYNAKEPQGGQKRARTHAGQRYEICEQCNEEFDVLGGEECVWHDGTSIQQLKIQGRN
jgi:hypothetical protein